MLKFNFPENLVPPDGYVWTSPNGHKVKTFNREPWYAAIKKHCEDNGIPMPPDWKEQAAHQMCLMMSEPGMCVYEDGQMAVGLNTRLTLTDFLHGSQVLAAIALEPDPLVDQELADSRALLCSQCPANIHVPGCAPCVGIANMVVAVKGSRQTKADHALRTCAVCKCANTAQVWVKKEILAKGVDATQLAQMSQMPDCWKAKELS